MAAQATLYGGALSTIPGNGASSVTAGFTSTGYSPASRVQLDVRPTATGALAMNGRHDGKSNSVSVSGGHSFMTVRHHSPRDDEALSQSCYRPWLASCLCLSLDAALHACRVRTCPEQSSLSADCESEYSMFRFCDPRIPLPAPVPSLLHIAEQTDHCQKLPRRDKSFTPCQ